MSRDARIAEKLAKWAEADLAAARDLAKGAATPEEKRLARRLAKEAKRRHSRAHRRAARAYCRDYDD